MKVKPFGFRILVEVDKKSTDNILSTSVLVGKIIEIPEFKLPSIENLKQLDNSILLYYYAEEFLKIGTKIWFNNDPKIVNTEGNIYNVPIEFIRSYENE